MTGAGDRYDDIGRSYARTRREDPRIAAQIHSTLGVGSVVNVGAGSGNYEPIASGGGHLFDEVGGPAMGTYGNTSPR